MYDDRERTLLMWIEWLTVHLSVTKSTVYNNVNHDDVIGPLCGEFTGPWLVTRGFDVFFICTWINSWVNNRETGDLRRHSVHYDVTVIIIQESRRMFSYRATTNMMALSLPNNKYDGFLAILFVATYYKHMTWVVRKVWHVYHQC